MRQGWREVHSAKAREANVANRQNAKRQCELQSHRAFDQTPRPFDEAFLARFSFWTVAVTAVRQLG